MEGGKNQEERHRALRWLPIAKTFIKPIYEALLMDKQTFKEALTKAMKHPFETDSVEGTAEALKNLLDDLTANITLTSEIRKKQHSDWNAFLRSMGVEEFKTTSGMRHLSQTEQNLNSKLEIERKVTSFGGYQNLSFEDETYFRNCIIKLTKSVIRQVTQWILQKRECIFHTAQIIVEVMTKGCPEGSVQRIYLLYLVSDVLTCSSQKEYHEVTFHIQQSLPVLFAFAVTKQEPQCKVWTLEIFEMWKKQSVVSSTVLSVVHYAIENHLQIIEVINSSSGSEKDPNNIHDRSCSQKVCKDWLRGICISQGRCSNGNHCIKMESKTNKRKIPGKVPISNNKKKVMGNNEGNLLLFAEQKLRHPPLTSQTFNVEAILADSQDEI